jgi:hypothetical protein
VKQIHLSVGVNEYEKSGKIVEVAYLWTEQYKHMCMWLYKHTYYLKSNDHFLEAIIPLLKHETGKEIERIRLAILFQSKPKKQKINL